MEDLGFWDLDLVNLKGSFTKVYLRFSDYRMEPDRDR